MGRVTTRRRVLRVTAERAVARPDTLVTEEPLEVRLDGAPLTVTMRTPGHDFDLAAGFLVGEGVFTSGSQLAGIRYCAGATDEGLNTYNVVDVVTAADFTPPEDALSSMTRNFYTTSSCGLCGKASLDAVRVAAHWEVRDDPLSLTPDLLATFPEKLRAAQRVFDRTGGLHAAALFTETGELLAVREDVGRHNAVDKLAGWALREDRLPLSSTVLMVSGRASFELVQKAVLSGIPALAAVSAPSSLAVDLAEESGMTLVGFLRGSTMNVYTGAHRLGLAPAPAPAGTATTGPAATGGPLTPA